MSSHIKRQWLEWLIAGVLCSLGLAERVTADPPERGQGPLFYLLVDRSGSMEKLPEDPAAVGWRGRKIDEVKRQLNQFLSVAPDDCGVAVLAFDVDLFAGPAFAALGAEQRRKLQAFINSVEPDGKKTHLWTSLNRILKSARQSAESWPGRRVHILVFTDGEDNEPDGRTAESVLAGYQDLLKEQVRLSYISLGLTMQAERRDHLHQHRVEVIDSLTPDDIIPVIPGFRWVPEQPRAGQVVQIVERDAGTGRATHLPLRRCGQCRTGSGVPTCLQ